MIQKIRTAIALVLVSLGIGYVLTIAVCGVLVTTGGVLWIIVRTAEAFL